MTLPTRLNLGCGEKRFGGFLNVDKYGDPDQQVDLELFPWPWPDNHFEEVVLFHVLEHLGATSEGFLGVIRELYRICAPGALVRIAVPHPRHNDFLNDPTHVRPVTAELLQLFSVKRNLETIAMGAANSTLAMYQKVDFEIVEFNVSLDEPWKTRFFSGELSEDDLNQAVRQYNNVVSELSMSLQAMKPWRADRSE